MADPELHIAPDLSLPLAAVKGREAAQLTALDREVEDSLPDDLRGNL